MMHPKKVAVMIMLICLGVGAAAVQGAGDLSPFPVPQAATFSPAVYELKPVKSEDETLSEYIWNSATDLLQDTYLTTFIAGVDAGNLDPTFYGAYTMQDAAWCREVAKLWRQLSYNESMPEVLRAFANHSYSSYQDESVDGFEAWNIKDDGEDNYGVNLRYAATNYLNVIRDAILQYPPNVMIATYACSKLWANVTADLWSFITSSEDKCSNTYKVWVEDNMGDSYAISQAAAMDEWDEKYHWYNWTEAASLFRTVMQCEISFFNMEEGAAAAIANPFKARLNQPFNLYQQNELSPSPKTQRVPKRRRYKGHEWRGSYLRNLQK